MRGSTSTFVDGEISLLLDLQSLLHDKSPKKNWKDCATLHVIYRKISELSLAKVVGKATVLVDAAMLEQSESAFCFPRGRSEYDLALAEVHRAKTSSPAAMMYYHRVDDAKRQERRRSGSSRLPLPRKAPRFAFYEMERPSCAVAPFHEYLRDLGLATSATLMMPAASWQY